MIIINYVEKLIDGVTSLDYHITKHAYYEVYKSAK